MKNFQILNYEHHNQPLLSTQKFLLRVAKHVVFGLVVILVSLGIGILGYHLFERFSWLDSLMNASMILGGMGPVNPVVTPGGKVFASFYALFSGIIFLVAAGVMVAPVVHRLLHIMHMDDVEQ